MKWIPLLLVITGNLTYHLCQKSLADTKSPMGVIFVVYFFSLLLTGAIAFTTESPSEFVGAFKQHPYACIFLGVGCVLIEVGFLWAYRIGWKMSLMSSYVSPGVVLTLMIAGLLLYRETISLLSLAGLLVVAFGIALVQLGR